MGQGRALEISAHARSRGHRGVSITARALRGLIRFMRRTANPMTAAGDGFVAYELNNPF